MQKMLKMATLTILFLCSLFVGFTNGTILIDESDSLDDEIIVEKTQARATQDWEWSTAFGSLQSDETWG